MDDGVITTTATSEQPLSPPPAKTAVRVVNDPIPVLDTARFEHMQRVATIMAETSTIPDSLRMHKVDGKEVELPRHRVIANCFMIVNQAVRWNMDPFAIAQCASIVHGKLMWEGKLVAAVIEAKLGIRLRYTFTNEDKSTPQNRMLGVIVSGTIPGELEPRTIEGDVANWHKGDKSPWAKPADWKRQLRYMGSREWARAHSPGLMLGILADDEGDFDRVTRDVTPPRQTFQDRRQQAATLVATDIPEEDAPAATQDAAAKDEAPAAEAKAETADETAIDDLFPADKAVIAELQTRLAKTKPEGVPAIEKLMAQKLMSIGEDARTIALGIIQRAKQ